MSSYLDSSHADILVGPHQLALDITNNCNLRCLHCFNYSGENIVIKNELTDSEVIDFIKSLVPLQLINLCFCGGEPLLRKDLLLRSAEILTSNNITHVSFVTNGILLTKELAKDLKKSGVNRIQVSLDGYCAEHHDRLRNKAGVFEKAIEALKIIEENKFEMSVAFTPTSFNIDGFTEEYHLLEKISSRIKLRVQPLMLLGRASENLKEIQPTEMQYRGLVRQINLLKSGPINIEWGDPIDHLIRFSSKTLPVNQCSVRANGDITVSPYIPLVIGNIRKHSFTEYWNYGLNKIWDKNIPRTLASQIMSISDMTFSATTPNVFKEDDIYLDLFENDLNDISLIQNSAELAV